MLRHALKLIWYRRRANRLVVVEIAAAFVLTFVLTAWSVNLWSNYRRPLGFEYENVWSVNVVDTTRSGGIFTPSTPPDDHAETVEGVMRALRALPRADVVAPLLMTPFSGGRWQGDYRGDGDREIVAMTNRTTVEGLQAIGVTLVEGRWFGPDDDGQAYRPVLVNRTFVEQAFDSGQSAVGRRIDRPDPDFPYEQLSESQVREALREIRIVGVIEDFRQNGEFYRDSPYVISRHEPGDASAPALGMLLKVAPGTDASFEEQIVSTVASIAPGWVASVTPWSQLREQVHRETLLPMKAAATIAAFFIALVVMGLIGVLWQDVVRRTQEIGLRRALGAGAASVRRQIQLEMLIVGAFGTAIGAVIAIQFPLLELVERIDWASGLTGIGLAAVLILALVALGALYPSWLASRREPADALRYE